MSSYAFDHQWVQERERLDALGDLLDFETTRILSSIGIQPGQSFLEIGAGSGTIANWFAKQTGPSGRVVATDLTTSFMQHLDDPAIEVQEHNLMTDDLDDGEFDIAHARLVLEYIPEAKTAIERMFAAVRPGGWIVVEDIDVSESVIEAMNRFVSPPAECELHRRLEHAIHALFSGIGADPGWGSRIPETMREVGVDNLNVSIRTPYFGGMTSHDFPRMTVQHLQERIVAAGLMDQGEVDHYLDLTAKNELGYPMFQVVSAWAQRPA